MVSKSSNKKRNFKQINRNISMKKGGLQIKMSHTSTFN